MANATSGDAGTEGTTPQHETIVPGEEDKVVWEAALPKHVSHSTVNFENIMHHDGKHVALPPTMQQLVAELDDLLATQHKQAVRHMREWICRCDGLGCEAGTPRSPRGSGEVDGQRRQVSRMLSGSLQEQPVSKVLSGPLPERPTNKRVSVTWDSQEVGRRIAISGRRSSDDSALSQIQLTEIVQLSKSPSISQKAFYDLQQRLEGRSLQARLLRLTSHWAYELCSAAIIFTNALLIAWETQNAAHQVRAGRHRAFWHSEILMYTFCAVYSTDLILRIVAQGCQFFYSLDWRWNIFDTIVVLGYFVEVATVLIDENQDSWLSVAPALRVVRVVRVTKVIRALRSFACFRDLRITISMLCDSIEPLITFSSIMALVFLVFGIILTDGATKHLASHDEDMGLDKYYGDLLVTMSTLFKGISGGVDWENAMEPLMRLSSFYSVLFYVYLAFSTLAMLTTFNALFVASAVHRASNDRDYVIQTEMQCKTDFMTNMDKLFQELDRDRSGTISLGEFQNLVMEPKVNAFFRGIGLNVSKVKKLFQLMDTDRSGDIDRREFVDGCTQLRGEATNLDLAILQFEVKDLTHETRMLHKLLHRLAEHIDQKFEEALAPMEPTTPLPVLAETLGGEECTTL